MTTAARTRNWSVGVRTPKATPGGAGSVKALSQSGLGRYYVQEAYKHLKVIAALADGRDLLAAADLPLQADGIIHGDDADAIFQDFADALGQHRVWSRNAKANDMPA